MEPHSQSEVAVRRAQNNTVMSNAAEWLFPVSVGGVRSRKEEMR